MPSFMIGAAFEPTTGVDFVVGLQGAKVEVLSKGHELGSVLAPDNDGNVAVPVEDGLSRSFFFSVGFDLNIFRQFFGSVAKVGGAL